MRSDCRIGMVAMKEYMFFFFFSSRRRHTRLTCDWSSDVCSSDLAAGPAAGIGVDGRAADHVGDVDVAGLPVLPAGAPLVIVGLAADGDGFHALELDGAVGPVVDVQEIGRASCRERV